MLNGSFHFVCDRKRSSLLFWANTVTEISKKNMKKIFFIICQLSIVNSEVVDIQCYHSRLTTHNSRSFTATIVMIAESNTEPAIKI